jgi:MFS family permease
MPDDELPQLRYWQDADAEALAPRLDRGTLTGCLGILCVLLLPVLLALPLSDWRVPLWVARLVPLLGVAALALGAWLLAHVPPRVPPHSTDPEQPLTRMGKLPVQERPATRANHLALALVAALAVAGALGYLLADTEDLASGRVVAGTVLSGAAGCALIGYGWLVGRGRAAPPAWRWVRAPIRGAVPSQVLPLMLLGLVALGWSLMLSAGAGYVWAPLGIGALLLAGALAGPIQQRWPQRPEARQRERPR